MRLPFVVSFPIHVGVMVKPIRKVVKKLASTFQRAVGRGDYNPTFILLWLISVFDQSEVKLVGIELNRFIVISNNECHMNV